MRVQFVGQGYLSMDFQSEGHKSGLCYLELLPYGYVLYVQPLPLLKMVDTSQPQTQKKMRIKDS